MNRSQWACGRWTGDWSIPHQIWDFQRGWRNFENSTETFHDIVTEWIALPHQPDAWAEWRPPPSLASSDRHSSRLHPHPSGLTRKLKKLKQGKFEFEEMSWRTTDAIWHRSQWVWFPSPLRERWLATGSGAPDEQGSGISQVLPIQHVLGNVLTGRNNTWYNQHRLYNY